MSYMWNRGIVLHQREVISKGYDGRCYVCIVVKNCNVRFVNVGD